MEAARTQRACNRCRGRKIKCSGTQPCRYCVRRRGECIFPDSVKKKLYSVDYVQDLEAKAAALRLLETSGKDATPDQNVLFDAPVNVRPSGLTSPLPAREALGPMTSEDTSPDPGGDDDAADDTTDSTTIVPDSVTSSSLQFGRQINSLPPKSPSSQRSLPPSAKQTTSDDVYGMVSLKRQFRMQQIQWPSPEDAHGLLDGVLSSVGRLQQLFEPRLVSDRLSMTYQGPPPHTDSHDLWNIELLMVFALGKLLQGISTSDGTLPGTEFYLAAEDLLPDSATLRSQGTMAVEILGMMVFFLQCADRREDAYVYAGIALRLAISNGMAREQSLGGMTRSERTHRNRLWWTIYMQERRLAAATGNPLSIHDDAITSSLPSESPGFGPTAALNMNIKLARITGQTMSAVYSNKNRPVTCYARCVKKILSELLDVAHSMPSEHSLDFSKPLAPSRTTATLYLMLYQCIMLATRPTLLHMAKGFDVGRTKPSSIDPAMLEKLSNACIEAATRSLQLLQVMMDQNLLAKFGFFDLDATLSAAFVFVLVESIYPTTSNGCGGAGIRDALSILRYLASQGNKAAAKRAMDIDQMCHHLGIAFENMSEIREERFAAASVHNMEDQPADDLTTSSNCDDPISQGQDQSPDFDWSRAAATLFDNFPSDGPLQPSMSSLSFAEGGYDSMSFYIDQFVLTGVAEEDWEELSRQFTNN